MRTRKLVSIDRNLVDRAKRWLACAAYALVCIIAVGCQSSQPELVVRPVPRHPLQIPEGTYGTLAWLSNDRIVLEYRPRGKQGPETSLWIMRSDGSEFHALALPADTQNECSWTGYHDPVALSDGRAAYVRSCHMEKGNPFWSSSILVLDAKTETSQRLFNYQIPEAASFSLAFGPDLSRGVGATYSDIEHYMFRIDNSGIYTIEFGLLRPNRPAWSSDGKTLAFFGNRTMSGDAGPIWATQAYDLWLMSADCVTRSSECRDKARILLQSVGGPTNVAWSPDGKWLVFDGDVHGRGDGIWLFDASGQQSFLIAAGNYAVPTWSPDGKAIIAVAGSPLEGQPDPALVSYSALALLDVSEIVSSSVATP
jgi:dipeptidyl aminopeptidase/acylaminoacyl peptidase